MHSHISIQLLVITKAKSSSYLTVHSTSPQEKSYQRKKKENLVNLRKKYLRKTRKGKCFLKRSCAFKIDYKFTTNPFSMGTDIFTSLFFFKKKEFWLSHSLRVQSWSEHVTTSNIYFFKNKRDDYYSQKLKCF